MRSASRRPRLLLANPRIKSIVDPQILAELEASTGVAASVIAEMFNRQLGSDYFRWAHQVERAGYCARPVRLRGRVKQDGVAVFDTASEPDGVLLKRCGTRRSSRCPSCSYEYAGDMWQLLYAGAVGGRKGVPESVSSHPLAFVTLTAPGFGAVHGLRDGDGRCRPRRKKERCPHGRTTSCRERHSKKDPVLGEPLCLDCYDHQGAVLFNWHAPDLWKRFTIALRRALAHELGLSEPAAAKLVRVSYAKVAELQRRGVVHFHAVVRLDGARGQHQAPPEGIDVALLERAVHRAASRVALVVQGANGERVVLRFGLEVDVRAISANGPQGAITSHQVAAYVAKYATKAAEDFGLGDRPLTPSMARELGLSEHVVRLVEAARRLAGVEGLGRLQRYTHMLGFRGHFASKSRRYSTTLSCLRNERAAYRQAQERRNRPAVEVGTSEDQSPVVAEWAFAGQGYLTTGEARLAAGAAASAREARELAKEAAREAAWMEWAA